MPLVLVHPQSNFSSHFPHPHRQTTEESMSRTGFLGTIKSKFSHKSDKSSTTRRDSVVNDNPFAPTSPATRRPDRRGMNAFTTPSNEPPPAYSRVDNTAPSATSSSAISSATSSATSSAFPTASTADDRYAFLTAFDTIFLIDDSGSMAGRSWRETASALETITPICVAHDADGIDIYFLNAKDSPHFHNVTSSATVREIFSSVRPQGGTPTGQRLNQILAPYLRRCKANLDNTKPLNIIVITDGEPSDDVESVIIGAAKKLDRLDAPAWQVGIQFFQVGREPGAKEHLKQLDDELGQLAGDEDLRDIVDTVPFLGDGDAELTADGIMKVVLGAVNRRLDRKKSKELHRR